MRAWARFVAPYAAFLAVAAVAIAIAEVAGPSIRGSFHDHDTGVLVSFICDVAIGIIGGLLGIVAFEVVDE